MHLFWHSGHSSTVDDLVKSLRITRHTLYGDFGGKDALFENCLDNYRDTVVSPAFAPVEMSGATLETIAEYFETQISLAERTGLPGPGCLMANTMTDIAPHVPAFAKRVDAHNDRLQKGFENAIKNHAVKFHRKLPTGDRRALANMLVAFANGLWSLSRTTKTAAPLRTAYRQILALIEMRIS